MVTGIRRKLQELHNRTIAKASLCLRPTRFGLCLIFSILLATGFLASWDKPEFFLGYSRGNSWPSPQTFWILLSQERRSRNQCSYSACLPTVDHNKTQFPDPFNPEATSTCPFYFRWIHEDLAPWMKSRISRQLLETAKPLASFRVVIKSGRLYVDPYEYCYQTRAVFTIWGLLQLLKFHPGLVPDVDLLFGCGDVPLVLRRDYNERLPPPIFRYCSTVEFFDIPFPDWSFWGWPEVDLRPWVGELYGILKGDNETLWADRDPTAFWKGNTDMGGGTRRELLKCDNRSAQIFHQDWRTETDAHFKNSRLAEQCRHRYKVYVEGIGWSVSLKYILACDSPALVVDPLYFEFFSRGLIPKEHYWPVRPSKLCDSIKFAVDWGNNHTREAETIGKAGRQFVTKEVSMKHVYDYMLHSLREYAKLLDFEPSPGNMTELCSDSFVCLSPRHEQPMYEESRVQRPSDSRPCFLPSRDEELIKTTLEHNQYIIRQVQESENTQWGVLD